MKKKEKQSLRNKSSKELIIEKQGLDKDLKRARLTIKEDKNKHKANALQRKIAVIQTIIREKELTEKKK